MSKGWATIISSRIRKTFLKRWAEYIDHLYSDDTRDNTQLTPKLQDKHIMNDKVLAAFKEKEKGKAIGQDNIYIEHIDALEDNRIEILTEICNSFYNSGTLQIN